MPYADNATTSTYPSNMNTALPGFNFYTATSTVYHAPLWRNPRERDRLMLARIGTGARTAPAPPRPRRSLQEAARAPRQAAAGHGRERAYKRPRRGGVIARR